MVTNSEPSELDSNLRQLAKLLIDARNSGAPVGDVPDELVPPTVEDAQKVDDLVAEMSGWPVLGWKIGCTSTYAQELLGADGPFAGRIYTVLDSGARLDGSDMPSEGLLEGEFAFTLSTDIAADSGPIGRSDVLAAIADVRPAIEVVGGRYAQFVGLDLRLIVADAGANGLLVVGPAVVGVPLDELDSAEADMEVDGERTGAGTGADVLGHPVDALYWLTDHLAKRGINLEAGQIVTTGTATQVSKLPAGSSATANFAGVGSVTLSRT